MGKYVDVKQLYELQRGDIVRGKSSGTVYVVIGNYGSHVTAAVTADITNPKEWEVFRQKDSPDQL